MIQRVSAENPEENVHSREGAARGAAVGAENAPVDPDLQAIIKRWPDYHALSLATTGSKK